MKALWMHQPRYLGQPCRADKRILRQRKNGKLTTKIRNEKGKR